jgi:hypothetical protein
MEQINKLTEDMWNLIDSNCVMPEALAQEIDETISRLVETIEKQSAELAYLRRYKEVRERTW